MPYYRIFPEQVMAKWGEGDPRWIVEERADATNVNNWHWTEKNATPWSKDRLKALLENMVIEEGPIEVKTNLLKKCEGEASANNRKGKLIFLFEWELEVTFVARVSGTDKEYEGSIEIPNLSDENEAHEVDISTSIKSKGPHDAQIREFIQKTATKSIHEKLAVYINELKTEFSKGIILPTGQIKPQVVTASDRVNRQKFQNMVVTEPSMEKTKDSKGKEVFETKTVTTSETFKVPPERLFEVLREKDLVCAWSNCNPLWDFREGGNFALFGGNVSGTFTTIEPNKRIEMKWRLKNYPSDHYATMEFNIKDMEDSTQFEINASNVPAYLADETKTGLERYYIASIGRTFGFSSRIH